MAEITLEPTALSKVIPISLKVNETDAKEVTRLATKKQFNTSDTDAWLSFTLDGLTPKSGVYDLTMVNVDEKPIGSIVHHTNVAFSTIPFHYKLDSGTDLETNEIRHAGRWIGQIVVRMANGDTTSRQFDFAISGHLIDGNEARLILVEDYNALIATITASKDELTQYNVDYAALLVDIAAAEDARVTAYNQLLADQQANIEAFDVALDDGIVAANLATKLQDFEATNNSRLLSAEQQLADTLNKSAITLTHMFADNTARDAYFVAHPTELIELQFVKVGTAYQQYIEGAWTDSVPIVSEQISATNQPIVDTGEYFVAETTNDALQELGAHKASATNPHGVTKTQVGLGNVDNTSDANKPVSTATQTALNLKANKAQEAWITPTLTGGATFDAYDPFRYRKNEFGLVECKGKINVLNGNALLTFLVGYRTGSTSMRRYPVVKESTGDIVTAVIESGTLYVTHGLIDFSALKFTTEA